MSLAVGNAANWNKASVLTDFDAGSASDRILVVAVAFYNSTFSSISYGGNALTLIDSQVDPDGWTNVKLFYLLNPPSGSNSWAYSSSNSGNRAAIFAVVLEGADTSSIGVNGKNSGNSASPGVSLTPGAATSIFVAGVSSGSSGTAITARGGSTVQGENNDNGNERGGIVTLPASSTSAHDVGATSANDFWAIVGVEIKEAAAAPAGGQNFFF